MKKYILTSLIVLFCFQSYGQVTETYWKAESVTKVNKTPIKAGILTAYMEMIEEMQLHLSKKDDSLFILYPYEKKMKTKDLISFSNVRYVDEKNELIDSIYDVDIKNDSLKIKFHLGNLKDENCYILTFSPINKQIYFQNVENLKSKKNELFEMLKTVDYSTLDLSTPKPKYFNDNINLNIINPVQLAEMISVNNDGIQTGYMGHSFNIQKKGNLKYTEFYIQRTDKLDFVAAKIGKINFNNIKLIYNEIDKKTDAVILYQMQLKKQEIIYLFESIDSKLSNAEINKENLNNMEITWSDNEKIIKMIIKNFSDDINNSSKILADISNSKEELIIKKELENYILSIQEFKTIITIVSKGLAEIAKSDEFKSKLGGMPFTVDYNH